MRAKEFPILVLDVRLKNELSVAKKDKNYREYLSLTHS